MDVQPERAVALSRKGNRATIEEWLAIPEEKRAELLDGVILYHGMPGMQHGEAQGKTFALVDRPFGRRAAASGRPGGWWISLEVDMEIDGMGVRPDIVAWRRSKHPRAPEPDARGVITAVPDWICEVLSKSTATTDKGQKRRGYHRAGVEHYWLLDPNERSLMVLERAERDYLVVLSAGADEVVRAPPFEEVEMAVAEMFREEEDEPAAAVVVAPATGEEAAR